MSDRTSTARRLPVLVAAMAVALGTALVAVPPASAATLVAAGNPLVSGVPRVGGALTVIAGSYSDQPDGFDYQWYADGAPVGPDAAIFRPGPGQLGRTITVEVTAHHAGDTDAVTTSAATARVVGGGKLVAWARPLTGMPADLTGRVVTAIAGKSTHYLALTSDGTITSWGPAPAVQTVVPASLAGKTVVDISAAPYHALALTSDGTITAWGNNYGQLDLPPSLTGKTVIAISAGSGHSLALTSDGTVVAWGSNSDGQLDVPASLTGKTVVAISAGASHSLALTSDGTVVAWGNNGYGALDVPSSLVGATVTAISAGGAHSVALTSEGRVVAWGQNIFGQLNIPAVLNGETVVAISANGADKSLALTSQGVIRVWGPKAPSDMFPSSLTGRTVIGISNATSGGLAIVGTLSGSPAILGTVRVGRTLTAGIRTIAPTPDQLTYTWYADDAPLPGATASTLVLTAAQLGARITVQVTATKAGYDPITATSAPSTPVGVATFSRITATVRGVARVGQTLTARSNALTPAPDQTTYAWSADGVPIDGETLPTLTLTRAQLGTRVTVTITATKAGYAPASATSPACRVVR